MAHLQGLTALVNNHYDTDGLLSIFSIANPRIALQHREKLLNWAAAGDFFQVPNEEAFCFDELVMAFADPERSPIAAQLNGLSELERYRVVTEHMLDQVPHWLENGLKDQAPIYQNALDRLRRDTATLQANPAVPLVHFDATVWTIAPDLPELPGRHAMQQSAQCDRMLLLAPDAQGTRARFWVSTLSWFELPDRKALPRPDLEALATTLNGLEGSQPEGDHAWRSQSPQGPSPELWFGKADAPLFLSHMDAYLGHSKLDPMTIKAHTVEAMRTAWVFENEDETGDLEDIYSV